MTTLVLLRHAKAGPHVGDDSARELTARGRADAAVAGEWLRAHGPALTGAVVSTSTRTRQTFEALGLPVVPVFDERVYDASLDTLLEVVEELSGSVLLVGHNPGIERLAFHLTGETGEFRTCALAVVAGGALQAFAVPRA